MLSKEVEKRVQEWLSGPIDPKSKEEIRALDEEALHNAFYTNLSFGTGGMRGLMGVGTNRMNRYTVQRATQGLANYLLKEGGELSVFLSYDSRHHSKEFAEEAARVLAGNGIRAYVTLELRPTPYVSFGVRQKRCSAGIMITASHNPKEYNGYKVYWKDGAQVVPPHDCGIIAEVEKIQGFDQVKLAPKNSPLIEIVDLELDVEYLDAIHKLQIDPKEDKWVGDRLKIIYTPLHGTGLKLVPRALKSWGFSNIHLVNQQSSPNGDFPTVKSPNPESPEALKMGIKMLEESMSDLLIATDPDADRVGVVVLHKEKPALLSGNQIAVICLEYICSQMKQQGRLPKEGAAVTTIVSTDLLKEICAAYEIGYYEVLTGFKYIGELIRKWEDGGPTFLFGAEESHGYLIGTHSRDKDAVVTSCLIAEIALLMNVEGRTLVDYLEEIYQQYGRFLEGQRVIAFPPGQVGMEKMTQMMEHLRHNPPSEILGQRVTLYEDYKTAIRTVNGRQEELLLPQSDVLLFRLEDKSKVVVRPSGTEPKLKIYGGVHSPDPSAPLEKKLDELLDATEALLS